MMAKMFYTLDETKATLGKSEEEVKQFAREGRLREFRDGPRLMFKADQVDQLKAALGDGSSHADMGVGSSDSGILGLADTAAPSGSGVISLADTDFGKSPGPAIQREDTALEMDLGLGGTVSGIPSPGRTAGPGMSGAGMSGAGMSGAGMSGAGMPSPALGGTGMGMSGTGMALSGTGMSIGLSGTGVGMSPSPSGSRGGITVFDVDDAHKADPMAQTAIGSGISDQVQLESVGSGSGLLEITREQDDTSLGAELLDEIHPESGATTVAAGRRPLVSDSAVGMATEGPVTRSPIDRTRGGAGPVFVEKPDATAAGFGALALFGTIVVLFGAFVLMNALMGTMPEMVQQLSGRNAKSGQGMIYLGAAAVGSIVFFIVGWVIGKAGTARR